MECPVINCVQKVVLYETKARLFVVGSNNTETRFRVLKIDRTEPRDLHFTDDRVEYSPREIREILLMIDQGNRPKVLQKGLAGLSRTASAFGIVGFVRFLEGYYIVLITKRRKVAQIGHHTIYKIEDTAMAYIPNDTVRYSHPDEQKYLKFFQNVDLWSNFYFSYSYDLTHTLQYNLTPTKGLEALDIATNSTKPIQAWPKNQKLPSKDSETENAKEFDTDIFEEQQMKNGATKSPTSKHRKSGNVCGVRISPSRKFAWNNHMLKPMEAHVHPEWLLYVIHGFITQQNVCVYGKAVYITLIARRSNQFAGTRFLKRGANCQGDVANEVETEQIVHDSSVLSFQHGRYTSYVQMRGSIPFFWSQDISKIIAKPPIVVDQADPYHCAAGHHFGQLLKRYGAPIIVLNLVKKREKRRQECILTEELLRSIQYLNQFLPPDHRIQYIGFDMARFTKRKNANVLLRLAEIAEYCVKCTGFFHTGSSLHCNGIRPHPRCQGLQWMPSDIGMKQHGILRTNCVDCLDRTNTAQFAIGKCALAFQLHSLGIIDSPTLDMDTDCVRMLEELYEDQGDTLALQYGGSQLVHRVKDYRKLAPWTSSSRDIMQTLSRYYSNAFSDSEKQNSINLFLGVFEPTEGAPNMWDLSTDFYLHNNPMKCRQQKHTSYSQWWEGPIMESLPLPHEEETKCCDSEDDILCVPKQDERVDSFQDYYRPTEFTPMDELFGFHMPNSIRDYMPKGTTNYSPFVLRARPGRRREEAGINTTEVNPNISGKEPPSSISSTGSESTSSSEGTDLDGDIDIIDNDHMIREDSGLSMISLKDLFPTMRETYGVEIKEPEKSCRQLYRRFTNIGQNASSSPEPVSPVSSPTQSPHRAGQGTILYQTSVFPLDSSKQVEPPKVSSESKNIYETYIQRGKLGASSPSLQNKNVYHNYARNKYI